MREHINNAEENAIATQIILVVGNSRSGTTMLGRVFGNHPLIFTFNELHFYEELWDPQEEPQPLDIEQASLLIARLLTIQRDGYFFQKDIQNYILEATDLIKNISGSLTPPKLFEAFLMYETHRHGKSIACLQTPRNVYYLEEILALHLGARVVNIIRDPRAILLSQKKRWMGRFSGTRKIPIKQIIRTWADYHPITISLMWRSGIQSGDSFASHQRVHQVRFEDLVVNQDETLRTLCNFVGLEFYSEMLEIPQIGSSNRPDQYDQKGINASVADRWRQGGLEKGEIYIVQKLCKEKMKQHRYTIEKINANPISILYYGGTWGPKMGLALLLNIKRVRNLVPAIRKRLLK